MFIADQTQPQVRFAAKPQPALQPVLTSVEPPPVAPSLAGEKFFTPVPVPTPEPSKPVGFKQRVAYVFNSFFNSKKIRTPMERCFSELIDRVSGMVTPDKVALQANHPKGTTINAYSEVRILIDGKPYTYTEDWRNRTVYQLVSADGKIHLILKATDELAQYHDRSEGVEVESRNSFVLGELDRMFRKLSKVVRVEVKRYDKQEMEITQQANMKAKVEALKKQLELEQKAKAGHQLRY